MVWFVRSCGLALTKINLVNMECLRVEIQGMFLNFKLAKQSFVPNCLLCPLPSVMLWSHSSWSTNACFILLQGGKSGSDHSYNVPNGGIWTGHGASFGKGHGPSDVENGPSAESYHRRH